METCTVAFRFEQRLYAQMQMFGFSYSFCRQFKPQSYLLFVHLCNLTHKVVIFRTCCLLRKLFTMNYLVTANRTGNLCCQETITLFRKHVSPY